MDKTNENKTEWYQRWQPVEPFATDVDRKESLRLHQLAIPKQCWFNARWVVQRVPAYHQASYVEGWVMHENGMALEHGWVVKNGKIIDPTLPTQVAAYFPGLEVKGREGIEEFLATPDGKKCKRTPFFFAFGWGGMSHPGMRRAWDHSVQKSARDGPAPTDG
jgi:hypothetical protein